MTKFMGRTGKAAIRARAVFRQELSQLTLDKIGRLVGEKPENMVVHAFYDLPDLRAGTFSKTVYNGYDLDTSPQTVSLLHQIKNVAECQTMPIVAVAFKTISDDDNNVRFYFGCHEAPDIYRDPKYSANGLRVVTRAICYVENHSLFNDRMLVSDVDGWMDCGLRADSRAASSQFPLRIYPTVNAPDYLLTNAMLERLLQDKVDNLYFQTPYDFIQKYGIKSRFDNAFESRERLNSELFDFYNIKSRMEDAPEFDGRELVSLVFKRVAYNAVPGVGKFCQNPPLYMGDNSAVIIANLIAKNRYGKFETHPRGWTQTSEYAIGALGMKNDAEYQKPDWVKTMLKGYRSR